MHVVRAHNTATLTGNAQEAQPENAMVQSTKHTQQTKHNYPKDMDSSPGGEKSVPHLFYHRGCNGETPPPKPETQRRGPGQGKRESSSKEKKMAQAKLVSTATCSEYQGRAWSMQSPNRQEPNPWQ